MSNFGILSKNTVLYTVLYTVLFTFIDCSSSRHNEYKKDREQLLFPVSLAHLLSRVELKQTLID